MNRAEILQTYPADPTLVLDHRDLAAAIITETGIRPGIVEAVLDAEIRYLRDNGFIDDSDAGSFWRYSIFGTIWFRVTRRFRR